MFSRRKETWLNGYETFVRPITQNSNAHPSLEKGMDKECNALVVVKQRLNPKTNGVGHESLFRVTMVEGTPIQLNIKESGIIVIEKQGTSIKRSTSKG